MARLRIFGNRSFVGDDDLTFIMTYHGFIRILMCICLISSIYTYSPIEEHEIPKYFLRLEVKFRYSFGGFLSLQFALLSILLLVFYLKISFPLVRTDYRFHLLFRPDSGDILNLPFLVIPSHHSKKRRGVKLLFEIHCILLILCDADCFISCMNVRSHSWLDV